MANFTKSDNEVLDRVIRSRHSVRQYTDEIPAKEMIEQIIESGRLAPYAGLPNIGTTDFRRFFVLAKSSAETDLLKGLTVDAVKRTLTKLEPNDDPQMKPFLNALRGIVSNGPKMGQAPWLIIIAERRGFPAREEQALAYCLENMWLKATALGLGIQLYSAIDDLKDDDKFCEMLGLTTGEFSFDACSVGFPLKPIQDTTRPEPYSSITWFES